MLRKRINQNPFKTMLVVTASEAEALYFSQMRKDCRYANMHVQWAGADTRSLEELVLYAAKLRTKGKFDSTWVMFGFADLGVNAAQVKAVMPLAESKKIRLVWTNPSLPLWFLLHLQAPKGPVMDPAVISKALGGPLPGFASDARYLLTDGMSLHLKLYPAKAKAALNASAYNEIVESRTGLPATNIPSLLNEISDICGLADLSHNQKLVGMKNS